MVNRFSTFGYKLESKKEYILFVPLQLALAEYKDRLFTKGLNSSGEKIQQGYKRTQRKARKKRGRQVEYVDFNFTGSLEKDIVCEDNGRKFAIMFHDPSGDEKAKADLLDNMFGGQPFDMSEKEIEDLDKEIINNIDNIVLNLI